MSPRHYLCAHERNAETNRVVAKPCQVSARAQHCAERVGGHVVRGGHEALRRDHMRWLECAGQKWRGAHHGVHPRRRRRMLVVVRLERSRAHGCNHAREWLRGFAGVRQGRQTARGHVLTR